MGTAEGIVVVVEEGLLEAKGEPPHRVPEVVDGMAEGLKRLLRDGGALVEGAREGPEGISESPRLLPEAGAELLEVAAVGLDGRLRFGGDGLHHVAEGPHTGGDEVHGRLDRWSPAAKGCRMSTVGAGGDRTAENKSV